jgi:pimeloyl-ACP methyl ester carboxylesterase
VARFLLIHGSCHGAWCWRDLVPALAALGHQVRAIDLPSHGGDPTPLAEVTLDSYARAIRAAIDGPTILVGHSMAGYPITAAAELDPAGITRLVYLCAYVPAPGQTLAQRRRSAPRQPLVSAIRRTPDGLAFAIDPAETGRVFYQDCPPGTVDYANARLCPQAILPQETVLAVTDRSRLLPRSYIRCTQDQTIPPEFQTTMVAGWPARDVHDLPSGHSPFFSMPARLAELLDRIARPQE